jgi:hypothetical protein
MSKRKNTMINLKASYIERTLEFEFPSVTKADIKLLEGFIPDIST